MAQPLGKAFLLVNSYVGNPNLDSLTGADKAALQFWDTFYKLHFQPVIYCNLTRDEFDREVTSFVNSLTTAGPGAVKYVVFFFMGHGSDGDVLYMQDGSQVTTAEIDDLFSRLPDTMYRIFFIDACRSRPSEAAPRHGGYSPKYPNTILARSTLPYQVAWPSGSNYGLYSKTLMDALLTSGGTVQSALDSVRTQLQSQLKDLPIHQYPQYVVNAIPPLCWEADVESAGGRLTPPSPPQHVLQLRAIMEGVRKVEGSGQSMGGKGETEREAPCGQSFVKVVEESAVSQSVSPPTALPSAEEVLMEFRDRFVNDMEADVVASALRTKHVIPQGCQEQIYGGSQSRELRNEILHDRLVRNCTREALIDACDIFIAEKDYAAMIALGKDMKVKLEPAEADPEEVLEEFRDRFVDDMDAAVVASALQVKGVIPEETKEQILHSSNSRKLRNEILHDRLVRNCTREALIVACDIFIAKKNRSKINALGEDMKKKLEPATGK